MFASLPGLPRQLTYHVVRSSSASPQTLYDVLLDAPGWARWAPLISTADWEGPGDTVGSVRVLGSRGVTARERITELDPPHRHAYVIEADTPARGYRATVTFAATPGGTTITWVGSFEPHPPVVGHAYGVFVKWYVGRLASALVREAEARA